MSKVFISYRREDSQYAVDRIYEALAQRIPKSDIFIDVDNIPPGVDFVDHLSKKVAECDILLAVIGSRWLNAADETGKKRLDLPGDFVRVEIASALERGIPVVPVLLDGTDIPNAIDLPEDLKALERRNGASINRTSFQNDLDRLMDGLKLGPVGAAAPELAEPEHNAAGLPAWIKGIAAILILGVMGFFGVLWADENDIYTKYFHASAPVQETRAVAKAVETVPARTVELTQVSDALVEKGQQAYNSKGYNTAFNLWLQACSKASNDLACSKMMGAYLRGYGTAEDRKSAYYHFDDSCNDKRAEGCYGLARMLGSRNSEVHDDVMSVIKYRAACNGGHAKSCTFMGDAYYKGFANIKQSPYVAQNYYETACKAGETDACKMVRQLKAESR
jgi:TPR repeat protein